jgi:hypothetical protein
MSIAGVFHADRVIFRRANRVASSLIVACLMLVLPVDELFAECGANCSHPEKACLCVIDPEEAPVEFTPLGSFERRPTKAGQALDIGDELINSEGDAIVELACTGGSRITLHGRFRAVIMPGEEGQDCAFNLLSGAAEVLTEKPTQLESGEAVMGSKRTQYGMRVWRDPNGAHVDCLVFDGEVQVRTRDARWGYDLTSGGKAIWSGGRPPERLEKLSRDDIRRSSMVYARADVARLQTRGVEVADPGALRGELQRTYALVMSQPHEVGPRIELAAIQARISNPTQALFHLQRAESLEPARTEDKTAIAATKWFAYKQRGQETEAEVEAERVRTLDPGTYRTLMRTSVPVVERPTPETQTVVPEPRQVQPEGRSEPSTQTVRPTLQGSEAARPTVQAPALRPIVVKAA